MYLQQVLYIDLETSDRIKGPPLLMPEILQLAATTHDYWSFKKYVMPEDPNFVIDQEATQKNGLTKKLLLKKLVPNILPLDIVWSHFLFWLQEQNYTTGKPILICAFNGFDFDFQVLNYRLKCLNIKLPQAWFLIDPFFDRRVDHKNWKNLN